MEVGRSLGARLIFPLPFVLIERIAVVAMLHVYHIGIQVDAKVFYVAKAIPQVTLRHQDGGTVIASEQDAHPLLERLAVRLVMVHSLAKAHAVL